MILRAIAKLHFVVGLGMFLFVGLMVVSDSVDERALLLLPVVIMFMAAKILHTIDQANEVEDMMYRYKKRVSELPAEPPLSSRIITDCSNKILS